MRVPIDHTGPASSGQGGFAAGLLAQRLPGPAQVRLHRPVPLGVELRVEATADGQVAALHEDAVVLTGQPVTLGIVPPPVPPELVRAAPAAAGQSPAPMCIVCGPAHPRSLRVFPAAVDGAETVGTIWRPPAWVEDGQGHVRAEMLWAVLDCPGAWAVGPRVQDEMFLALGTIAADLRVPVAVGEEVVVLGWPLDSSGRKHRAGTAIVGLDGQVRAVAEQTCIAVPAGWAG